MKPEVTLLAIAGGTGSGKSTLARRLRAKMGEQVALIEHDWYYRDRTGYTPEQLQHINYDEPAALESSLLLSHLQELKAGRAVWCPAYDFATHTRRTSGQLLTPAPIVVVEGILLLADPILREVFDLRIYVDTADDVRLLRRIRRDIVERGRDFDSVAEQYEETVRPMHLLHVEPSRRSAHLIVPEGGENDQALDLIVGGLSARLS